MMCEQINTVGVETVKCCVVCNCFKILSEFPTDNKSRDRLRNRCKVCAADYKRAHSAKNKETISEKRRAFRAENKERISAQRKISRSKPENKQRKAAYDKARREADKNLAKERVEEWKSKNKEKHRETANSNARKLRAENPSKYRAKVAARRAGVKMAMPKWADKALINEQYLIASSLQESTGIPHHVDHFHPLVGHNYSGLHVPWNLRVASATENIKKSNKFPEEHYHLFFHCKIIKGNIVSSRSKPTVGSISEADLLEELNAKVEMWYS